MKREKVLLAVDPWVDAHKEPPSRERMLETAYALVDGFVVLHAARILGDGKVRCMVTGTIHPPPDYWRPQQDVPR